jgi:multidrug efflux pump subunit AcrA (membrane-fusion protein)
VAIDQSYLDRLGTKGLGASAEIRDQKVEVTVVTKGIRAFTTTLYVFTSLDQAQAYVGTPPNKATYFLVRLAPHADVESVRSRLRTILSDSEVLTPSGDISAMGVRAELDERDFGGIKIGQMVLVRSAAFRDREFAGKVFSISPIVQSSRIGSRDQRNLTDVSVAEVVVDLAEPGPLAVGMKEDVYFRYDKPRQ